MLLQSSLTATAAATNLDCIPKTKKTLGHAAARKAPDPTERSIDKVLATSANVVAAGLQSVNR